MLSLIKKIVDRSRDLKKAEDIYKSQVNAIQGIVNTRGFEEMINWWENQYTKVDNDIDEAKGELLDRLVVERRVIKRHLYWLYRLKG